MYKSSTPGDREYMRKHLPIMIVMTKLELKLPLSWNTTVAHIFMARTVQILALPPTLSLLGGTRKLV